ncbi:hypothetical protein [Lacticaseibacillus jixiensis]|uniref:hypothetical protein n=1 Tax=Lacticaseibacillus jixiensis TaxID=3231926 RepID=UPI0036F2B58E
MLKLLPASIDQYDTIEVSTYEYFGGIAIALRCSTNPELLLPVSQYVLAFPEETMLAVDPLVPANIVAELTKLGAIKESAFGSVRSASGMTTYNVVEANLDLITRWNDCKSLV